MATTGLDRLAGRRILITGAASGMGASIARLFAREGASLALLDISGNVVTALAEDLGQVGIEVNVADPASVDAAVATAAQRLGGLDGVVNVAGILREGRFEASDVATMDYVLAVNLKGPMNICRASLPLLRAEPKATIVNISSMAAVRPPVELAIYAASKAGLLAFGIALAGELGTSIRLNTICPGIIRTPMVEAHFESGYINNDMMQRVIQLGRPGTPDEIAEAALFFTSDASSFVSASMLTVNGGQLV